MIGQSVINVKSGGRGRLSTLVAGVFLLIMVVFLGDWVARIPMAALVAVMIMVGIGTFNWSSIRNVRHHPKSSSVVMISTVIVVVWTHDLARGVLVGVLLSALFFARRVAEYFEIRTTGAPDGESRHYQVLGQVFFASADRFIASFNFKDAVARVTIDLTQAHFWDITAIAALDTVVLKFRREGTVVEIIGLNDASTTMVDTFALHDKPDAAARLLAH